MFPRPLERVRRGETTGSRSSRRPDFVEPIRAQNVDPKQFTNNMVNMVNVD
jgi:hypothetical protein